MSDHVSPSAQAELGETPASENDISSTSIPHNRSSSTVPVHDSDGPDADELSSRESTNNGAGALSSSAASNGSILSSSVMTITAPPSRPTPAASVLPPTPTLDHQNTSALLKQVSVKHSNHSAISWPTVLANATGNLTAIINAWDCYTRLGSWSEASSAFASAHMETSSTVYTLPSQCGLPTPNPKATDTFTLCDGVPRVRESQYIYPCLAPEPTTSTFSFTTERFSDPSPTCTIATNICNILANMNDLPLPYGTPCPVSYTESCLVSPCYNMQFYARTY